MAINATAVWRVRPSGNNANGGGYDAAISGAGTDYSQQNAAQTSGTAGTAAGTTAFSDAGAAFTSQMVGNAIKISSGAGFTAGLYFCTGFTNSTNITLDRSPGTGSAAVWSLGGGWANFWTNTTAGIVPGNIVYILGSGMPVATSYVYDYTATQFTSVNGNQTAGAIRYMGDPATPSSGYPCIKTGGNIWNAPSNVHLENLWFVLSGAANPGLGVINGSNNTHVNVIFDAFGWDMPYATSGNYINCEFTSSVAKRSTNTTLAATASAGSTCYGCNFHDCIGGALAVSADCSVSFNVFSKNGGGGIVASGATHCANIFNNTLDANIGNGLLLTAQADVANCSVYNNIFANHVTASTFGIKAGAGTQAANDLVKQFIDYNVFYNNTTNLSALSQGAHDTTGGANPFNAESTNDFSLTSSYKAAGATPNAALIQKIVGWNSSSNAGAPQDYISPGAIQPNPAGGGTTVIVPNIIRNIYMTEDQADGSSL